MRYVAGFDIGGTKIAVTLAEVSSRTLRILHKVKVPTLQDGTYKATLQLLCHTFEQLVTQAGLTASEIGGIGISCGGPLDSKCGVILSPPNLPGWDNVPITEYFSARLGVPCALQNDADACALAEWKFGAGQGTQNMVFLTFGTGLGAGLILNGTLYSGTNGMAGEIGHCRSPLIDTTGYAPTGYGKTGSFEGFCSGGGIAELGRQALLERFQQGLNTGFCPNMQDIGSITAKTIGDAAEAGDSVAQEIYKCSGRHLGATLSVLVDLLNPELIVIGSIYARSTELLRDAALEVLNREALTLSRSVCKIAPAMLGEDLGDIAALTIALSCMPDNGGIAICEKQEDAFA